MHVLMLKFLQDTFPMNQIILEAMIRKPNKFSITSESNANILICLMFLDLE